jgi:hypothetical protein
LVVDVEMVRDRADLPALDMAETKDLRLDVIGDHR